MQKMMSTRLCKVTFYVKVHTLKNLNIYMLYKIYIKSDFLYLKNIK